MNGRIQTILIPVMLALAVFSLIIGCSKDNGYDTPNGPSSGGPGPNNVWLQNFAFNPATLTVGAGTTITWTNKDNVTHTVTSGTPGSPNGLFDSGNLGANATFTFTFDSAATYLYYCAPHAASMQATVVVQ